MVSAPPPRLWGDLEIFAQIFLGGELLIFLDLGGPCPMGGLSVMMGGVSILISHKLFLFSLYISSLHQLIGGMPAPADIVSSQGHFSSS